MRKIFDGAFFDFDGTIADTGEGIFECAQYALSHLGFAPATPEQLRAFIGPPIFDSFKSITGADDETCVQLSHAYRTHYREGGILKFRVYDGIPELFDELKANGVKLAVVSSKPERFILRILDHLGKREIMDYVSCPTDDDHPESKTQLIERACKNLELPKSSAVMIGDRKFDILGAAGAGIRSIGAAYGYGSEEELSGSGADYIAFSAAEIRNLLLSE